MNGRDYYPRELCSIFGYERKRPTMDYFYYSISKESDKLKS